VAALGALLAACAPPMATTPSTPETPLEGVRFPDGAALDAEGLEALLREVDVVYVGERHDAAVDHEVQARVVSMLGPDVVGMEMFQQPFQAALDAYGRGEIDEPAMLERTEWAARWGMPFDAYRPVVEAARAAGARVVALNAPREWTRTIARQGLEALAPEVRAALPELDTTSAEHRAMVMEALSGHGAHGGGEMSPETLERFYLAQLLWDEAMGARLAEALAERPGLRAVVIAGRMHVQRGLGIPRTASRRGVARFRIVLPLTAEEIEAERAAPTGLCDVAIRVPS
jgi:uncharacterized iron-regulated protein